MKHYPNTQNPTPPEAGNFWFSDDKAAGDFDEAALSWLLSLCNDEDDKKEPMRPMDMAAVVLILSTSVVFVVSVAVSLWALLAQYIP